MHQYCTYTRILVKLHTVSSSVGTRRRNGRNGHPFRSRLCRRYSCGVAGVGVATVLTVVSLAEIIVLSNPQIEVRSCQWESNIDSRHPRGRRGSPLGISS
jgi:hypothetical protein